MGSTFRPGKGHELRLGLAILLVAAALAWPSPADNENRTLDLVHALARGRLSIDAEASNTVDKAYVPAPPSAASIELALAAPASELRGGHFYSGGAPGLAFALLPAHLVVERVTSDPRTRVWILDLVGAALPLALGALAVRRALLALGSPEGAASAAGLVHALATTALPFGTRLYAHSLVVALVAGSLAAVLGGLGAGKARWALAGLLAASAVVCDYSAALPAAVLGLLALARGGLAGAGIFAAAGVLPGLGLAAYHTACFGSPLATPYDWRLEASTRALLATGAYGFTAPSPRILVELLVGSRRGFLWTQPAALLGVMGLAVGRKLDGARAIALLGVVGVLLANAARLKDWSAGASFGPRYASAALPFLALGYPRGLAVAGRAGIVVVGASFLTAIAGAATAWTFSVPGTFEQLWISGLHAGRTVPLALAVGALPLVLLGPRGLGRAVALGLLPLALAVPAAAGRFLHGPAAQEAERRAASRRELVRSIESAQDAAEARARAAIVRRFAQELSDPELYRLALERVLALDPADDEARARLEEVRGR